MLRLATAADAAAVHAIYAPVVEESAISFEWEPPTVEEMERRITETLQTLPWVVHEEEGWVMGYACATPHRSRLAYRWSVEVSVYVHPTARRRGVAARLYRALLDILTRLGYRTAYAIVALPNAPSVALHEHMGFKVAGFFPCAGYKNGRWHDTGWWRYALSDLDGDPEPPLPLRARLADLKEILG
jgi:L-amino acid N-acyltransferase YncA